MTGDYYAILGVSPTSEDVVIRAAYRALMRRYHPDTDSSSDATERARAINAAYAVLSDPEKRARYDGFLAAHGLIKLEPQRVARGARTIPRPGPLAAGA
ncbi:MAG: J domain-containing protein, partial [Sphingomonas sp.]|nr:J domain-containing protein [Sphingomonas sp.]